VNALLAKDDFGGARAKLDQAGIGTTPTPESLRDNDLAAARHAFEESVAQRFLSENQHLLIRGNPREAAKRLAEALRLCPWCMRVQEASSATVAIIANLDSFGLKVKQAAEVTPQDSGDLAAHRSLLREASQRKTMLNDSPAIQIGLEQIEAGIANFWESRIRRRHFNLSELKLLRDDLALLGVSAQGQDHLEAQLRLVATEQSLLVQEQAHRDALLALTRTRAPTFPKSVSPLRQLVASQLGLHTLGALRRELLRPDVEYLAIAFGEEMLAADPNGAQGLRQMVARSHLARAEQLAGSGRAAVLALVHLERAWQLGLTVADSDPAKLRDLAAASFAAAGRLALRLRVETNPSDEPILQDLARFAVTRSISRRARPHIHLPTVSRYEKDSDIQVSIDSIRLFVPSMADLRPVSSTYLSHYEDVPNPAKAALKAQLNIQRISVDYALSSLNSAITAFNLNPTQWTLQSMNSARTRYNFEVDTYNLIVQQYNLTAATVPRPVYLPYLFREGTVHHGWRMSGSVKVRELEERFSVEEVDTDFVRIGTRPEDRDVSRRRDDFLDIPVGTERLVQQLVTAADRVHDALGKVIRGLRMMVRPDLSEPEQKLLAAALYPFAGNRSRADTGTGWAKHVIERLVLPEIADRPVPTLRITRPTTRPRDASPEEIASFYAPVVALILSKDGKVGSGAPISGDGLILTAAHVLGAEPIDVVFPRAGDARRWPATLIFVNETHDVAVLRVTGHRLDRWFEIALAERAAAGEPVVAIGNPAIGAAGTAFGAVSAGIVAKPYDPDRSDGLAELVADIAVASGSSGGPLVSRRTGRIVGVVTAVVTPSVSKDFSTSGYWAVAAPSSELGQWLGIAYGP
jgi:S1-C subfamily serine protease